VRVINASLLSTLKRLPFSSIDDLIISPKSSRRTVLHVDSVNFAANGESTHLSRVSSGTFGGVIVRG
jgi:hypothetical protein